MSLEMFTKFSRKEWGELQPCNTEIGPVAELKKLVSINENLTQMDVETIYIPILKYIDVKYRKAMEYHKEEQLFYGKELPAKVPFIIGISGSVAVGKSTTARLLQKLLQNGYPEKNIELMTTDGFLYPNTSLKEKGIMERKGFPESYDMKRLLDFMVAIKTSSEVVEYPIYSHEKYDVVIGETKNMRSPDILIVEGINVLQLPPNYEVYMSDFFDLSIFVDADPNKIRQWFLERYEKHLENSKNDPTSYYYFDAKAPRDKVMEQAKDVWYTINYMNLQKYILPTRARANLIIHKTDNHHIDKVYTRKY